MRVTDPDVIRNGEKDLISAVKDDLDIEMVKEILKKRIAAAALSSTGGEIVVHNNEIAFRMDFTLNLNGSLMFDRQGNYIPESGEKKDLDGPDEPGDTQMSGALDLDDLHFNDSFKEDDLKLTPDGTGEDKQYAAPEEKGEPEEPEEQEGLEEQNAGDEQDLDFKIDLPDYGLDDEPDQGNKDPGENEEATSETENIALMEDDEITGELDDDLDDDLEINDLDPLMDDLEPDPEIKENDSIQDSPADDDIVDDDIDDILKDSWDFWDQKKDS